MNGKYNIAMFAYNEAQHITTAIKSIYDNVDDGLNRFCLIANGCTDATVEVANKAKKALGFEALEVVELALGDKCNAWNHYVHKVADNADVHFFVDADVTFTDKSFPTMYAEMEKHQFAPHIIAGYPYSGRNIAFYQSLVTERSCFFGNLYGASRSYIELLQAQNFTLPVGLNWIDSFLTKAANTDLTFGSKNLPNRVIHNKNAGFEFESLSPFSYADLKLYKNRIARYELGKIQEFYLDALPHQQWPATMLPINRDIELHFEEKTAHLSLIKRWLVKQRLKKLIAKEENA